MTNAKVTGLLDYSSFARHFCRSVTLASLSCRTSKISDNCVRILRIRPHVHQAVPLPHDSSGFFFFFRTRRSTHTLSRLCHGSTGTMSTHEETVGSASTTGIACIKRSKQDVAHHLHTETHHPCRRCNFAHHACTIRLSSGNSRNVGPVR